MNSELESVVPSRMNDKSDAGTATSSKMDEEEGVNGLMNLIMPLVTAVMEESKLPEGDNNKSRSHQPSNDPESDHDSKSNGYKEEDEEEKQEGKEEEEEDEDDDFKDEDYTQSRKRPRKEVDDWMPNGKPNKKKIQTKNTKKRRVRSIAQSRSIFKKAVLRVFLEQRKIGNNTLSLSQVWSLIKEAGLIKTMGKTPIQSVSCALSQDVLRGPESSFVRVGKGLYSLKDSVTEEQLEQYLEEDEEEDAMELEEQVPEKKRPSPKPTISSPQDSQPTVSPTSTTSTTPTYLASNSRRRTSSNAQPADEASPRWIGEPLYQAGKRSYYAAVSVNKQVFKVGTCAFAESPDESDRPFLIRISSFYEEDSKQFVEYLLYLYPEEVTEETIFFNKHEVLLSKGKQVRSVECLISGKVDVLSLVEYKERQKKGKLMEDIYFCTQYFCTETNTFGPIEMSESIYLLAANLDKFQPKTVVNILLAELQRQQLELQLFKHDVSHPTSTSHDDSEQQTQQNKEEIDNLLPNGHDEVKRTVDNSNRTNQSSTRDTFVTRKVFKRKL